MGPSGSTVPGQAWRGHPCWSTTHHQEWGLFLLEHLLHNVAAMSRKEWERTTRKHPDAQQIEMAEVMALAYPSIRTLLGSTNQEILDINEQVFWGEYVLAPNELPHWQQENTWQSYIKR